MRYLFSTIFTLLTSSLLASNVTQATDSLLQLLNTPRSSEQKIQICRNLADINLDNSSNAKIYLWKMYKEASNVNDRKNMLEALHGIVVEEINANHSRDSIIKYIDYIKKAGTPEDIEILVPLYHMRLFDSFCYLGKSAEAIKEEINFLDSNSSTSSNSSSSSIPSTSSNSSTSGNIYKDIASTYNIGSGFYMNGEYKKAVPYLVKALEMSDAVPEKYRFDYQKFMAWNLCFAYSHVQQEKKAIQLIENLIKYTTEKYENEIRAQRPFYKIELYLLQYYSYIFGSLSYLTKEQEDYYWMKTQQIKEKITSDFDKYNYFLCARNYYSTNRTKIDIPKTIAANDSLIRFARTVVPRDLSELYANNSSLYEELKDYKSALKYLRTSYQIRDSLNSKDIREQLNELQVRYDVNTLNSEKTQLELENKKMLLISLTVLLIIVFIICSYLYFSLKKEKRMKTELRVLHLKAQESEKMKQAFINSICHEIRTPLNAIVGFSDLIMNEDIDAEMRQEFPAEIQKSTILLTSLVNNMLEVANLDVSEDQLPCQPTDIRGICIQEMERIAQKPEITYKLDITEDTVLIPTNEQYLTLVIEHLLSNANKFTEKGEIILGYKINQKQNQIAISVTDTGCGIPKDKYDEVFNRFSKLDTFVPGNGLGLYLCRLIVKRLNGEVKIDPDYTEGTRMVVNLPI